MSLDPRTPVIVGTGQFSNRVDRGESSLEPVDLMAEALRRADEDTGAKVVRAADSVRVVSLLSWRYRDPGALVAERLGASPGQTAVSAMGGNSPQSLVNQTCLDVLDGRADVVLLTGAEAWRTRSAARRADEPLDWTTQDDSVPAAELIGEDVPMNHPGELARGVMMPVQIYPLFEHALRHAHGRSDAEHRAVISELWSRFSAVAAKNPHAWIQQEYSPAEIAEPTPDNRMVGYPYTKLLNSNNAVEQGAGLVITSVERADALGVPRDRWVFPLAGTDGHDHYFVSERADLHTSPAMEIAGRRCLELAGLGIDDVAHADLYSCFPSAVEISAAALGLALERQLTVTGGLSFAGGPWNNYVMHAIATMVGVLREDPGAVGLTTANGGYITKHAFGLYGTEPPPDGFAYDEPQAEIDARPRRELAEEVDGEVTVETHTVMFDREGRPERGIVAALLDDGRRAWGATTEPDTLDVLAGGDLVGQTATIDPEGTVEF